MITISTGGIGPMDITAGTKAKGSSKDEKAVDAFASLMNMVSTKQEQPNIDTTSEADVADVAPLKESANDYESYKKQENVGVAKDKLQKPENDAVKEDTQVNESNHVQKKTDDEDQQVKDIASLIKDVKNALKDTLDITDEEFENLLADMGIKITDLMLGDNLKNFILQSQSATNVDLLVNENLANMVNNLLSQISELFTQYGFLDDASFEQLLVDNFDAIENTLQDFDNNVDIMFDDVNVDAVDNLTEDPQAVDVEGIEVNASESDTRSYANEINSNIGDEELSNKTEVRVTLDSEQSMAQDQSTNQSNHQIAASFNQAIDNTISTNVNVDVTAFTSNIQEADIIRQIIDQIKVTAGREVQSMEVQLNPENLGKVYVNVEAKDGVMQAKIIAETEAAKTAIENNLAVLKENFSNNELKVEAIEVMVAAYGFFEDSQNGDFDNQEQAKDASKSVVGVNISELNEEELTQEEELEVEIMKAKGNTVSYSV